MSNDYVFNDTLPVAPLKIAALESCRDLAEKVNSHIINFRRNDIEVLKKRQENLQYRGYDADSYMLDCACPRFGSGEAKGIVNESVRGTDIYAMVDVTNYSLTYKMSGFTNHMSPDFSYYHTPLSEADHFHPIQTSIHRFPAPTEDLPEVFH